MVDLSIVMLVYQRVTPKKPGGSCKFSHQKPEKFPSNHSSSHKKDMAVKLGLIRSCPQTHPQHIDIIHIYNPFTSPPNNKHCK
jgi:hypothetical protein